MPSTFQLTAESRNQSVNLTWASSNGATGYELEVDGSLIDVGNVLDYEHDNLTNGEVHTYKIRSYSGSNVKSEWSPLIESYASALTQEQKEEIIQEVVEELVNQGLVDKSNYRCFVTRHSGSPVTNATVTLNSAKYDSLSDVTRNDSEVFIEVIPGKYTRQVSAAGYVTQTKEITIDHGTHYDFVILEVS